MRTDLDAVKAGLRQGQVDVKARQSPAAFLSIKTQFDNLGDALINRELCRLVASRAQTWMDVSRAPADFERAMAVGDLQNLTILRKRGFLRLMCEIVRQRMAGRECYLFLNPGGLGGSRLPLRARLSAATYNLVLSALRLAGVRICHVGISFDAMPGPELRIARWRRRLLHFFAVRDRASERYVGSVDMTADALVPDLSFNLYATAITGAGPSGRSIAFSFRFDGKSTDDAIHDAVRRVIRMHGTTYEYLFVAQVARDLPGMQQLGRVAADMGANARVVNCTEDIDALCTLYAGCRAIFSNRLHALLMAAYAGAMPFALVSPRRQPKIEGMFNDLGLGRWLIDIDDKADWHIPDTFDRRVLETEFEVLQSHFDALLHATRPAPLRCGGAPPAP